MGASQSDAANADAPSTNAGAATQPSNSAQAGSNEATVPAGAVTVAAVSPPEAKRNNNKPLREYTAAEVNDHSTETDCWLIIHGYVYDVTPLLSTHPGGELVLLSVAGLDASDEFDEAFHPPYVAKTDMQRYLVGKLKEE